ncbi:hypothetical protein QWY85_10975 [Neolewinella lacunae]|uniref:6-bladed beta-propeller n=1 Tax=Neolewinella lacunae TaxID=1517758 RepID=A0A923PR61_9BACT|nr:hypothetical protein [Neolewinella lacunae]MBC6995974.1 hypothetical protein [Neolewinella lacunae]MDN3635182.1 hypothetical protein [Neolewinella lacunae]
MHLKALTIIFLALSLLTCSGNQPFVDDAPHQSFSNYEIPLGSKDKVANITSLVKNVTTVKLSDEVNLKIGSVSFFFVLDSMDMIIGDKNTGWILRIDQHGKAKWGIQADKKGDYRYYTSIHECAFDPFNQQLVVYDFTHRFYYDLSGNFIKVERNAKFTSRQMYFYSNSDIVYSAQGLKNFDYFDTPKQLIWEQDNELKSGYIEETFYAPSSVMVGGFEEFSKLNGMLTYHPTFRDTFYSVDLPNVYPDFTLRLKGMETTDDVMKMEGVIQKLRYVYDRDIPLLQCFAVDSNKVLQTYIIPPTFFFNVFDRNTEKILVNHQFLKFKEHIIQAPLLYHDGYFLTTLTQDQVDHCNQLDKNAASVSKAWRDDFLKMRGEESKVLYLIEV